MTNSNPYLHSDKYSGSYVDAQMFARDLCAAMRGTLEEGEEGAYGYGRFTVEGVSLTIGHGGQQGGRVTVRSGSPEIDRKLHFSERGKWPSATVSTSRPIDTVAVDIARRVLRPAKQTLTEALKKVATSEARCASLLAHVETYRAMFPWLEIRPNTEPGNCEAAIFGRGDRYLSGRLYADGRLSIDRLASLDEGTARRVLAALGGEG